MHKTSGQIIGRFQTEQPFYKDGDGNAVKKPYQAGASTAYTKFVGELMSGDASARPEVLEALQKDFLSDSMLGEKEALVVLKGISSGSLRQEWEDRWRAAGKEPPTSVQRYNKDEIESSATKLAKSIDNDFSNFDLSSERNRTSIGDKIKELATWVDRGKPMGADVKEAEAKLKYFQDKIEKTIERHS